MYHYIRPILMCLRPWKLNHNCSNPKVLRDYLQEQHFRTIMTKNCVRESSKRGPHDVRNNPDPSFDTNVAYVYARCSTQNCIYMNRYIGIEGSDWGVPHAVRSTARTLTHAVSFNHNCPEVLSFKFRSLTGCAPAFGTQCNDTYKI